MKKPIFLKSWALLFCLSLAPRLTAQPQMLFLPRIEEEPDSRRLTWTTKIGTRYLLQTTDNLNDPNSWESRSGYPVEATSTAQQHLVHQNLQDVQFYRVVELDEQAPAIIRLEPSDDSVGFGRYDEIHLDLEDRTGINTASIQLKVAEHGPFTLEDEELSFEEGSLNFWLGGDTALADYGETVQAELTIADTLGNVTTHVWSFTTERDPVAAENLLVLGSPEAQRQGQRLTEAQQKVFRAVYPDARPIRMNENTQPYTLIESGENQLVFEYLGDIPPDFSEGQYLANATPAYEAEVFYRRVVSTVDDPDQNRLTVRTEDVPLWEIIAQGSLLLSGREGAAYVIYQIASDGLMVQASGEVMIGGEFFETIDFSPFPATFELDGEWSFIPKITATIDIQDSELQDFYFRFDGDSAIRLSPSIQVTDSLTHNVSTDEPLISADKFILLGAIGPVPVWVHVAFNLDAEAGVEVNASVDLSAEIQRVSPYFVEITYSQRNPKLNKLRQSGTETELPAGFTTIGNFDGHAYARLIPQLDVRFMSLVGFYTNLTPEVRINGEAKFLNGDLEEASLTATAELNLNAGMSFIFLTNDDLPDFPSQNLLTYEWSYLHPKPGTLYFISHPKDQTVKSGDPFVFSSMVSLSDTTSYTWYHNDVPIFTGGASYIQPHALPGLSGTYHVVAGSGMQSVRSDPATLTVIPPPPSQDHPAGMARIPAGWFTMGRTSGDTDEDAPPVNVYVSEFYMARTEVTWALWNDVRDWAVNHGYTDIAPGFGKGATHPVLAVVWWDVVKWCNARSEREGLTTVYHNSDGTVFKTGTTTPTANWNANGYRLPTEAEWEKAARGGVSGQRFPWGNNINHDHANYRANGDAYTYDTSPYTTYTYHPTYNDGTQPYTSPVGSFAANGYGLHDMAGNVWEWCWDWYSASAYTEVATDPKGPLSGTDREAELLASRVFRGGSLGFDAAHTRAASRLRTFPSTVSMDGGFRPARSSVP
ncbi:MAG: SUMF1/EgtB/PvdO family nonheme iron enzyme [Kiritimatiellia bacterium]